MIPRKDGTPRKIYKSKGKRRESSKPLFTSRLTKQGYLCEAWRGWYVEPSGKRVWCYYSTKEYGYDEAYNLAYKFMEENP